eukprot:jgi/Botrbrau1/13800/Bobra.0056s0048.1
MQYSLHIVEFICFLFLCQRSCVSLCVYEYRTMNSVLASIASKLFGQMLLAAV